MAAALTVSFVWLDSISATSVWNRLSRSLASWSASRSQPIVSTAALEAGPPGCRIARTALYVSSQEVGGSVRIPDGSWTLRAGLRRGLGVSAGDVSSSFTDAASSFATRRRLWGVRARASSMSGAVGSATGSTASFAEARVTRRAGR